MAIVKKPAPANTTSRQAKATNAMGAMMSRKVEKTVQMKEKSSKKSGHN